MLDKNLGSSPSRMPDRGVREVCAYAGGRSQRDSVVGRFAMLHSLHQITVIPHHIRRITALRYEKLAAVGYKNIESLPSRLTDRNGDEEGTYRNLRHTSSEAFPTYEKQHINTRKCQLLTCRAQKTELSMIKRRHLK